MSKYLTSENYGGCSNPAPSVDCNLRQGELHFISPSTLIGIDLESKYSIFYIGENNRRSLFGFISGEQAGLDVTLFKIDIVGRFVVEWFVCEDDPDPEFHLSKVGGSNDYEAVCLEPINDASLQDINGFALLSKMADGDLKIELWDTLGRPVDNSIYQLKK